MGNPRNQILRNKGVSSALRLPVAARPARLPITPIPSRYADGVALSPLITNTRRGHLSTPDGVNDTEIFTLAGCVNSPVVVYLKKKAKAHP